MHSNIRSHTHMDGGKTDQWFVQNEKVLNLRIKVLKCHIHHLVKQQI